MLRIGSRTALVGNSSNAVPTCGPILLQAFHGSDSRRDHQMNTSSNSRPQPEHSLATLAHDVKMYKTVSSDMIKQKWNQAYSFYEEFSHMDEVREAHDKVVFIQNELQMAQQKRSDLLHELNFVRKELKMLQGEMSNCPRGDIRYLELVKMEIEANQRESEKLNDFQSEDQRERNLFTHLTAAVKASHEKEKIYANTVKYWSIIGSILGAALGVAGSALSYHYRQNTYKTITDNYTEQVMVIGSHIQHLQSELDSLKHEIKSARIVNQRILDEAVKGRKQRVAAEGVHTESWSSYLYRKTAEGYRWFWPRQTTVKMQQPSASS